MFLEPWYATRTSQRFLETLLADVYRSSVPRGLDGCRTKQPGEHFLRSSTTLQVLLLKHTRTSVESSETRKGEHQAPALDLRDVTSS